MALLALCAFLIRELGSLARVLPDLGQTAKSSFSLVRSWLLQLSSHSPETIQPLLRQNVDRFFSDGTALLDRVISYLLSLAGNFLSHVPNSALSLGTAVISAFLISAKLPKIRRWLLRQIPREWLCTLKRTGSQIRSVLTAWLTAQCKLTGVSFVILFLGLVILRIPHALLWALGICLVDAFPVLGVGTVLLPWSLVCLLQQDIPRAIGLASTYIAVTLTRSMLEPRFLGRHLGLDPLVTLIALYIGFRLWGIPGMILAPILTVITLRISHPQSAD
jgi:sporulation integral membrane protein YtvI